MNTRTVEATVTFQVDLAELDNAIRLLESYCKHQISDTIRHSHNVQIKVKKVT